MEGVGNVDDQPLDVGGAVPKKIKSVVDCVLKPRQHNPLVEGDGAVDLRPKEVPDEAVLERAVLLRLRDEPDLCEHDCVDVEVRAQLVVGVECLAMPLLLLLREQVPDDVEVLLRRRVVGPSRELGDERERVLEHVGPVDRREHPSDLDLLEDAEWGPVA